MAVMRNSIIFGGVDSADFGIYIGGEGTFNAPKRDVEMISIPGRNGAFALDKGRFENIEVTYSAFNFEPDLDTFSAQLEAFRNAICSQKGYQRLTDTFHPDEYRMAAYIDGLEIKPVNFNTASTFDIVFDCKPQRYLLSGEEPITIGEWHETETASGEIASFEAEAGDAVKSLVADIEPIQSLNGYDKPWSGGAGRNKYAVQIGRDSFIDRNSATHTRNNDVLTINAASTKNSGVVTASSATLQQLTASLSGTYTYSFDIKASVEGFINIGFASAGSMSLGVVTGWHRVSITSSDFNATEKTFEVRNGGDGSARTIEIRNFMIQEGSAATDYEPYSNICPISGHDEVGVSVTDEQKYNFSNVVIGKNWIGGNDVTRATLTFDVEPSTRYRVITEGGNFSAILFIRMDNFIQITNIVINPPFNGYITTESNCNKVIVQFQKDTAITESDFDDFECSISKEYETYTTDLGRTVYGGTLDVVSGVLTVTDENIASYNGETLPSTWISDRDVYASGTTPTTGAQVVYELATPTTVQLTAQEVELLVGLNQVWANSGDVTVEYGTAPNVLVNPTLFESSPMLEVEGYGNIQFNGYEITINDVVIGEIETSIKSTQNIGKIANNALPKTFSKTVDYSAHAGALESGDSLFVDAIKVTSVAKYLGTGATPSPTITSDIGTASASGSVRNYSQVESGGTYNYADFTTTASISGIELTAFTNETHSATVTSVLKYSNNNTAGTITYNISITNTSSGVLTIQVTCNGTNSGLGDLYVSGTIEYGRSYLYSTLSILGSPLYIDCDLGEAYKYEGGNIVSVNQHVDLGSDLPKLGAGENEITFDNTVTDLKVTPKWWKV